MNSLWFKRKELQCRCGCDIYNLSIDLFTKIENVREIYDKPIIITSGCRCRSHNKKVGGSSTSSHLTSKKKKCMALDIRFPNTLQDMYRLLDILFLQFKRIGINQKKRFFHVDVDRTKRTPCLWFYHG